MQRLLTHLAGIMLAGTATLAQGADPIFQDAAESERPERAPTQTRDREGSRLGDTAERQRDRQGQRVDDRVNRETDKAVDGLLDGLFD